MHRLAEDGVSKIRTAHVVTSTGGIATAASRPDQRGSRTSRLPSCGYRRQNFSGSRVHQTASDPHYRLGTTFPHSANTKLAAIVTQCPATHGSILVVSAELGDASHNYRIYAENSSNLCRRA